MEGRYFELNPKHVLGEVINPRSRRWGVRGTFTGLPLLEERPLCSACQLKPVRGVPLGPGVPADPDVSAELQGALQLGARVGRFLVLRGRDDHARVVQLWPELITAIQDFQRSQAVQRAGGNPWKWAELRELAERRRLVDAQHLLNAFAPEDGSLNPAIAEPPDLSPKFSGPADDIVGQATELFKAQRRLRLDQLAEFHRDRGGALDGAGILAALLAADWCLDGARWDEVLPARPTSPARTSGTATTARASAPCRATSRLRARSDSSCRRSSL
ncbi:hypothetical protein [Nannocystis pusilla]|uniref:hypothetical protein n=1 Tax=Nannocystis pusilla TaxID=889268 RepID=UPI003B761FDD